MQSKETPRARRVHSAEIKLKVLAECSQPGASVAAVALAHGLNANVVHKWRRGQGLLRAALTADLATPATAAAAVLPHHATALQFVPVRMLTPGNPPDDSTAVSMQPAAPSQPANADVIEVDLRRGANQVTVRWPATQAAQCTQWLRELSGAVLGADERAP
jgi:transposase